MKNFGIAKSNTRNISHTLKALILIACFLPAIGVQAEEGKQAQEAKATMPGAAAQNQPQSNEKLSHYIQRTYQVKPAKADLVVAEAIHLASQHKDIDPELILAVIAVESTFRAKAVSRAGARGLMQIMPRYHREKINAIGGTPVLFNPTKNMHVGTQILNEYLALSRGNLNNALLRYNGSLGKRSSYANKVLRKYRNFKRVA